MTRMRCWKRSGGSSGSSRLIIVSAATMSMPCSSSDRGLSDAAFGDVQRQEQHGKGESPHSASAPAVSPKISWLGLGIRPSRPLSSMLIHRGAPYEQGRCSAGVPGSADP